MIARQRIERTLSEALELGGRGAPQRLSAAVRHAVLPGGNRLRPRLTLAVANACGARDPDIVDGVAAAIELLHCASLVHDDLPCFDDADTRRDRPSVHRAFGEPLAVLAGDALIVLAFETLGRTAGNAPERLMQLIGIVARAVGLPGGIVAGQGWECEPLVDLSAYHRAKTGVLFAAATSAGAAAAGHEPGPWRLLGERLGEAYQVADDLRDATCDPDEIGKPTGRDAALGRMSAVLELGISGAVARLQSLIGEAVASIPSCVGRGDLEALIGAESARFLPRKLAQRAA